jgi:hypothetical protein
MIRVVPIALLSGAVFLNLLFLVFGNSELFPLGEIDVWFFVALSFLFALYRPGWAFLIFLSLLSFETVNLSPDSIPFSLRPYQLLGANILLAIFLRFLFRRLSFSPVKFRWFDVLPLLFALGGFFSIASASDSAGASKQAVVALSFVALYFLSRQFFGEARDARRALLFLVVPSVLTALFALWQSVRFTAGLSSFEVMPGRPNAFFPEPDWLGMFLIFSLSISLSLMFFFFERGHCNKEKELGIKNQELGGRYGDAWWHCVLSHNSLFLILYSGLLTLSLLGLLLTVARSAWVGFVFSALLFLKLLLVGKYSWNPREWRWKLFAKGSAAVFASFLLALFAVWAFRLTTFDIGSRAGSTVSGMQEITVSCATPISLPERIGDVAELSPYDCRHIRLEDIEAEKNAGKFISTVLRLDPSIEARRVIREKTFETLREHWLFGIGWGSIGDILGTDDRGSALNASNAFLEVWLGGGMISLIAFALFWLCVPFFALRTSFGRHLGGEDAFSSRAVAVFFLTSWVGLTVFNFFNSGILLGFVWVWLGAIGMIAEKKGDEGGRWSIEKK